MYSILKEGDVLEICIGIQVFRHPFSTGGSRWKQKTGRQKRDHHPLCAVKSGRRFYLCGLESTALRRRTRLAPGGASGIAILINYLTGCPIGLFVFVFNIPLLLIIVVKKYFPSFFRVSHPGVYRSALHCDRSGDRQDSGSTKEILFWRLCFVGAMMGIGLAAGAYGTVQHRGHFVFWD